MLSGGPCSRQGHFWVAVPGVRDIKKDLKIVRCLLIRGIKTTENEPLDRREKSVCVIHDRP